MQQPGELERRDRRRQLGADRRAEVLDVRDPHDLGLVGHRHPDRVRPQRPLDPPGDDRVLLAVLVGAQEPLAEVVVDRRVGAAADRAGEGDGADAQAAAAHQELRRGADERGVAAADRVDEAGRERLAQDAVDRGRVVRRRRVHVDLAGEHDLLQTAGGDQLDGAGNGGLEVLGGHRAGHHRALDRVRVEQRRRALAQGRTRACAFASSSSGSSSGAAATATVHQTSSRQRASVTSPTWSEAAPKRAQCGEPPPSGANAKPPQATRPLPGGPDTESARARATSPRQRAAARAKRSGPRSSSVTAAPIVASAERSRSGCSKHIQGSPAPREASTTALGSAGAASRQLAAGQARSVPPRVAHRDHEMRVQPSAQPLGERERPRLLPPEDEVVRAHVSARPLDIAISPVRIISIRPYGRTTRSNAAIFSASR